MRQFLCSVMVLILTSGVLFTQSCGKVDKAPDTETPMVNQFSPSSLLPGIYTSIQDSESLTFRRLDRNAANSAIYEKCPSEKTLPEMYPEKLLELKREGADPSGITLNFILILDPNGVFMIGHSLVFGETYFREKGKEPYRCQVVVGGLYDYQPDKIVFARSNLSASSTPVKQDIAQYSFNEDGTLLTLKFIKLNNLKSSLRR